MRVLVCEDDGVVARGLVRALRGVGYDVVHAADVGEALASIRERVPALALVDLNLPDGSGLEIVERLRDEAAVGVLVLTARDDETDRVQGLRSGADDYVVKPFSLAELLARVDALARRMRHVRQATTAPVRQLFAHGGLAFDAVGRSVRLPGGGTASLTQKESDLLALLLAHVGAAVPRETALDLVWGSVWAGGSRTLDTHVATLRAKLGDGATITTVRGVGYRLETAE